MTIRLLIADDHAVFRSGLRALLEKEEDLAVVSETSTGTETIEAARSRSFDVLILDISMPGLPTPRVAEAILQARPALPIVILTMHEDDYYLQEFFKIGVRAFVLKKSTGTDLIQAIRAAHRGEQYIDPSLAGRVIESYVGRRPGPSGKRADLLTRREQEVLRLLALGHTNIEIAEKLDISNRTVETHRAHVMHKLVLGSRADLVRFALDNGFMRID